MTVRENPNAWREWYQRKLDVVEPEVEMFAGLLNRSMTPRVLDVGCGMGRHVSYLAGIGVDTYGFDISEWAADETMKLLRKTGVEARVWVGDMFKPFPFEDGFFDGAIAARTIHHGHIREIRGAIAEIDRVTRPGGYVLLQVPELHDPIWDALYAPLARAIAGAADRLNRLQFLTIRQFLTLVFCTLVILLLVLAIWS